MNAKAQALRDLEMAARVLTEIASLPVIRDGGTARRAGSLAIIVAALKRTRADTMKAIRDDDRKNRLAALMAARPEPDRKDTGGAEAVKAKRRVIGSLTINTTHGEPQMPCFWRGKVWAVTKALRADGFTPTHQPSGRSICSHSHGLSFTHALEIARALDRWQGPYGNTDGKGTASRQLKRFVSTLRLKHDRECSIGRMRVPR